MLDWLRAVFEVSSGVHSALRNSRGKTALIVCLFFFFYQILPHSCLKSSIFQFPLFFSTQSQLLHWGRGGKLNAAFSSVCQALFSHKLGRGKALEKSLWAKTVVTCEFTEICRSRCEGKICHISLVQDTENIERMREAEGRRSRAVMVCQGLIQWVVVRPPVYCLFTLWFLYRPLPSFWETERMTSCGLVIKPTL